MSQELVGPLTHEQVLGAEYYQTIAQMDLTIIANRHATALDADKSTVDIPPGAIVFIEGYSTTSAHTDIDLLAYRRAMTLFNPQLEGKVRRDYYSALQGGVTDAGSDSYPQHGSKEILNLLDKGCLVLGADLRKLDDGGAEPALYGSLQRLKALEMQLTELLADKDLAVGLNALVEVDECYAEMQSIRENFARTSVIVNTKVLLDIEKKTGKHTLLRNAGGKLPVYLIYGTTHAKTLTNMFQKVGLNPTVEIVEPIPEYVFLDMHTGHKNKNRRLAFNALIRTNTMPNNEDLLHLVYELLEKYNDLPFEQTQQLIFAAISLQQTFLDINVDKEVAVQEYKALWEEFLR